MGYRIFKKVGTSIKAINKGEPVILNTKIAAENRKKALKGHNPNTKFIIRKVK